MAEQIDLSRDPRIHLLTRKIGAIFFHYHVREDVMDFSIVREGSKPRRIEEFRRRLNGDLRGMVHPDFLEGLSAYFLGQTMGRERFLLDMGKTPTGKYSWYTFVIERETDAGGHVTGVQGVCWNTENISGKQERKGSFRSERDAVTGTANEAGLMRILDSHLSGPGKNDQNAVILIRINNFKQCERSAGRRVSDALLIDLSKYIGEYFLPGDRLAHLGSACFAVFVRGVENREHITAMADNLAFKLSSPSDRFGRYRLEISTSVAWFPDDSRRGGELLTIAKGRL
ncbi:hypothetical protein TAMA11512_01350 [Selenomonas sp. TAMA-11512]|uniref:GGDEF domain-containing protein n=1 Tax=Selenomonas sp. TAMA-11512 TaxID=3095337 RepID=UPI0030855906|nr:hypothetical protein TAMA11512_01350 [Selenomonas sp. TAMA-11512]